MISVKGAIATIEAALTPVSVETIAISDAFGRVLAEDLVAKREQPALAVSSMDGYAVRARDVASAPATLTLIGKSRAGQGFDGDLSSGETVRIFTGAPLPKGADAVVMQEVVTAAAASATMEESVTEGQFVRPAGLDFQKGQTLLKAGTRLTPRAIGLAAAMNLPQLVVRRKPRIAILATGDELVMPGTELPPENSVNSNSFTLSALIRHFGGEPVDLGIAKDSRQSLLTLVAKAAEADLLVTTGGASVGDHDLVRSVLGEAGLHLDFWGVAARPGKPTLFGRLNDTPLLGLPGNPVTTVVGGLLFLRPAIAALLGLMETPPQPESARLTLAMAKNGPREAYLSAKSTHDEDGIRHVTPFSKQDSSMLAQTAVADCLILRLPQAAAAAAGDTVTILRLPSFA
ncbi:molybdopterin molybdotransferase MoeA [Rhodospirillaceae bacterium AH-315-P19]|nr:molybdopterin molybdotransferase MoeA [Rhodospirillaceae bacterium AH-315-P19]